MDTDFKTEFEKTADCHKTVLIEAAHRHGHDADVIWVNLCNGVYHFPKERKGSVKGTDAFLRHAGAGAVNDRRCEGAATGAG